MNILVTGANGQLGTEIINRLQDSTFFGKDTEFALFPTDMAELDITCRDNVISFVIENSIDIIINCAAYTAVDKAEDEPLLCMEVNRNAPANLAAAAIISNALLIHVSTDYVFDGNGPLPYKEADKTAPASVYGTSKVLGEEALVASGVNFLIFRTSWLYSPYGHNFLKTIAKLGKEKESLNVVFDQIGTPTYSGDLAHTILSISNDYIHRNLKREFPYGIYHFSNEGVCSWYDFALEIVRATGSECKVLPVTSEKFPSKAKRPPYSVMDKTKIKNTFSIEIPHWKDSLKECLNQLKEI